MGGICGKLKIGATSLPIATPFEILNLYKDSRPPGAKPLSREDAEKIGKLEMTVEEVRNMLQVFDKIDANQSNFIDIDEFCKYFKLERSIFVDRCFSIMDTDGNGEIDFLEFVVCVWNYCSFDIPALSKFAFDLFDKDSSGVLEMSEVKHLISEVYGEDALNANKALQNTIDSLCEWDQADVPWLIFNDWVRKQPIIMFPAFQVQQALRKGVLGAKFWTKENEKRIKWGMDRGKSVSIFDILDGDESTFNHKDAFAKSMESWNKTHKEKKRNSRIDAVRTGAKKPKRNSFAAVDRKRAAEDNARTAMSLDDVRKTVGESEASKYSVRGNITTELTVRSLRQPKGRLLSDVCEEGNEELEEALENARKFNSTARMDHIEED